MKRTKIVATMGPALAAPEILREAIAAGVNVFRLNSSHGDAATLRHYVRLVRAAAAEAGQPIAILQDLQGPKIRTGRLKDGQPVTLTAGAEITVTTRDVEGTPELLSTSYAALPQDVKPGDRILVSDGLLSFEVLACTGDTVRCRVVDGGKLKERQGMNMPGAKLSTPALTEKDRCDARLGVELGVDYLGLSFIRRPSDLAALRELLAEAGARIPIIAKIEKPEAVACLEEVLAAADGVMVARGDLGVEVSPEKVPLIQKRIIHLANNLGKPVITATQMLESMIANPRPTRAEASDVANAILDGTDAVMLSGETSIGAHPLEAIRVMARIAAEVEGRAARHPGLDLTAANRAAHLVHALARSAALTAEEVQAAAIVPFTITGATAQAVSQTRPRVPIHALTPDETTYRRMALLWGVQPLLFPAYASTDEMIEQGEAVLYQKGLAKVGDVMVCIAGASTHTPGGSNLLQIHAFDGQNRYARS